MDAEYYDITADIDAREILRYLNELGIRNINGEVLKYFITDLKKYIKYDLCHKNSTEECRKEGPERLHSASTFSSRLRSNTKDKITCSRDCHSLKYKNIRTIRSAPNLNQNTPEKPPRRSCSCVPVEKKKDVDQKLVENKKSTTSSNNLIKVPILKTQKKSDPVSLYHYYLSMWEKYKTNVPGENKWNDLRWSVRQKMAGCNENNMKVGHALSLRLCLNVLNLTYSTPLIPCKLNWSHVL